MSPTTGIKSAYKTRSPMVVSYFSNTATFVISSFYFISSKRSLNMKRLCSILLAVFFIASISEAANVDLRKVTAPLRKKCLAEIGLTAEVVDEAEVGYFTQEDKLGCYFKCMLEKFNMFTSDGNINYKMILMAIPDMWKSLAQDLIDSCRHVTGANKCELAYNFNICLYETNPVAYFIP